MTWIVTRATTLNTKYQTDIDRMHGRMMKTIMEDNLFFIRTATSGAPPAETKKHPPSRHLAASSPTLLQLFDHPRHNQR